MEPSHRRIPPCPRSVFLVLGLVLLVGHAAPADPPARTGTFTVAQFNVRFDFENDGANRWANRVELVVGLIQDAKASVACLQEDKNEQVEDLKRLMPGWEFVGKARDGRASERCCVAFDTAVWRRVEAGDFWLSDTPEVVGSNTWGCTYPHKVTWARLERLKDPGRRQVLFLSTHLEEHADQDAVRDKSVAVIRTWLAQHARGANLVVCGDFNAGVGEAAHAAMVADAPEPKLQDAWEVVKPKDTRTGTVHGFSGRSQKKRIDWILIGGRVNATGIRIDRWNKDGRYPSDHFAVVAELEVLPGGPPAKPGGTGGVQVK